MRIALAMSGLLALAGCNDATPRQRAAPSGPPQPSLAPPPPGLTDTKPNADANAPPVRADGTVYAEATMMGTHWSINVYLSPNKTAADAGAAIREAMGEVARIEQIASEWREDSELSRLSRSAGQGAQPVSPELFELLDAASTISVATDGSFDVTFHAVGSLWKFTAGARPPAASEIAARLPLVDHRAIILDENAGTVALDRRGMMLGLGAIAKGYAVDRAVAVMRARGFSDVIVEGGGDVFLSGAKGSTPWHVGIQDPTRRGAIGELEVRDQAVVTSGNYQRFFEYEGVRYAHILDPKTGRPIPYEDSPRSVSVIASTATRADAMATALAVMGTRRGIEFANSQPDLEAVMIDFDGEVHSTQGLHARFRATDVTANKDGTLDETLPR